MKRCAAALAFAVALSVVGASTTAAPAAALYQFSVPQVTMECTVNPDASVRIHYRIVFVNSLVGQPIDVVDVGLPHDDYDLGTMSAFLNGTQIRNIAPSSYIETGVEVNLGAGIASQQRGIFEFETVMPDLVFSDTTSDDLASMRITPTWFDNALVTGATDLRILIHLPPGVAAEEVLHQGSPFFSRADLPDHAAVAFQFEGTRFTEAHLVGISFPRRVMTRVVTITQWDLFLKWWDDNPETRLLAGVLMLLGALFFFMRFTAWTGWSVFVALTAGFIWLSFVNPRAQLYLIPVFIVAFVLMEWRTRKHKRSYLPPIASIEGGGIKRGLTAPEAAVLLEMPLGRVMTMVVFGMLRKSLLVQKQLKPLHVVISADIAGATDKKARLKAAARAGKVIHGYEHLFLDALADNRGLGVTDADLGPAMKGLVEHVADRVIGFDLEETRKYYRYQAERAWLEAEKIGELDARTEKVDKKLDWLLLTDDYPDRFGRWQRTGYHYRPMWGRPISGAGLGGSPVSLGGGASTGGALSHTQTSFGDVSAGFAGWTERVTGQLSTSLRPGDVTGGGGGVLNLSGFDTVTGDVLKAMASGSGSGGGGGGGGGCACAGCACACACAGGGR
ncbi:MAG: hypothetical protein JRH11_19985 [Deltaproteobacteria bacterium]|nr:hypothetical protein [Deltaproteobacteria bacterium]